MKQKATGKQIKQAYDMIEKISTAIDGTIPPEVAKAFIDGAADKLDAARGNQSGNDKALKEALERNRQLEEKLGNISTPQAEPEFEEDFMTQEELAEEHAAREKDILEYVKWIEEPITRTRGELLDEAEFREIRHREEVEKVEADLEIARIFEETNLREAEKAKAVATRRREKIKHARKHQSDADRKLTAALKRIAELEATVAQLTKERDAARAAYLELRDQQAKRGE